MSLYGRVPIPMGSDSFSRFSRHGFSETFIIIIIIELIRFHIRPLSSSDESVRYTCTGAAAREQSDLRSKAIHFFFFFLDEIQ